MPSDDRESLRVLRQLDEATEWELPREVSTVGTGDSSVASMPSDMEPTSDDDELSNICDCVTGMVEKGEIIDLVVIANTKDDEQLLFTNLERNDLIIGRIEIAKMNWYNTELAYTEEEEDE